MKVIATGGLAPLLSEGTTVIEHIDPDLTLDGLRMLAQRNPAPTLARDRRGWRTASDAFACRALIFRT